TWDILKDFTRKRRFLNMNKEEDRIAGSMVRTLEGNLRAASSKVVHQLIAVTRDLTPDSKKLFQSLLIHEDMRAQYELVQNESAFRFGYESLGELELALNRLRR